MLIEGFAADADADRAAAVCFRPTDRQQELVADCGLLPGRVECVWVSSCVEGEGRLEVKINSAVFECSPGEHLHQSQALLAAVCQRPFQTGKIESAEALPYHRFAVPLFLWCVCVCVAYLLCIRDAVAYCLFSDIVISQRKIYCPQQRKVILKVTSQLEYL